MQKDQKGFYLSTAIAYPNNRMHVGFAWEVLAADMVARAQRMLGKPVFFSTGLDEHSQNVEKAALAKGMDPQSYCDLMASDILKTMAEMQVSFDRFIRTSDADHVAVCKNLITRAYEKGDIYKQKYDGHYCDSCESFYTEKDALAGQCPTHKTNLRLVSEENYFFKLSAYQKEIETLLEGGFLKPDSRAQEIKEFVKSGLRDFSVSRTSFKFGVPVPWDPEHVIYVWYDALINYLSAVGYLSDEKLFEKFWPCDVHVIGKDITRFHCVYWPAMLLSTHGDGGKPVPLPKSVRAHGWLHYKGEKMSKSRGNLVTPDAVMKDYGVNSLRWYLLSANVFEGDGNYSDEDLVTKCNADLANNMGNLVNRVVSMTHKYFPDWQGKVSIFPEGSAERVAYLAKFPGLASVWDRMQEILGREGELLQKSVLDFNTMGYCNALQAFSMSLNKFIDETKPWALAKQAANDESLKAVLAVVISDIIAGIHSLALGLWPVVPDFSEKILNQIGLGIASGGHGWKQGHAFQKSFAARFDELGLSLIEFEGKNFLLGAPQPLAPRLELDVAEAKL